MSFPPQTVETLIEAALEAKRNSGRPSHWPLYGRLDAKSMPREDSRERQYREAVQALGHALNGPDRPIVHYRGRTYWVEDGEIVEAMYVDSQAVPAWRVLLRH